MRAILDHPCKDFNNKFGIKLKLIFWSIVYCYWHMVQCVDFFRYFAIQKKRAKINQKIHSDLRTGSCANPPQKIVMETKKVGFFLRIITEDTYRISMNWFWVILNEHVGKYGRYNLKFAVDFFSRFSFLHKTWSDLVVRPLIRHTKKFKSYFFKFITN